MRSKRLIILIIALLLISCGKQPSEDSKTQIRFWHSFVAATHPALRELISQYEAENPGIEIVEQYVPTGDALIQKLATAIRSNTAPDISWIHADFLDKLVQASAIYPMEHFFQQDSIQMESIISDIWPELLKTAIWQDTLFALPMEATTLGLVYNKDHFRRVGLDPDRPPQNWEELGQFVDRLCTDTNGDGVLERRGFYVPVFPASGPLSIWMVLQWSPFLWSAGGHFLQADNFEFHHESGVKVLSLWQDLFVSQDMIRFSLGHDSGFLSEQVSMIMDGPWDLPLLRENSKFEWGVAPLPAGPSGQFTYMAGEHLVIFRQSKHPTESFKFVKWILDPKVQASFSMKSGYLPVRQATLELEEYKRFLEEDAAMRAFVDLLQYARGREALGSKQVEINQLIAEAIERACMGADTPEAALSKAARGAQELLDAKVSPR
ncbi:MAG: ABC transporter substrate-binding protein [Candidatus Marinimicrobia bacterium]|nr:ABC transporter substrate-binding protein [Candidatus Neomarinimicrobiota bacterium]